VGALEQERENQFENVQMSVARNNQVLEAQSTWIARCSCMKGLLLSAPTGV